jgi:hypothetical protein
MKLTLKTLVAICTINRGRMRRNRRRSPRPNAAPTFEIRRPSGQFTAKWHFCSQANRLVECFWSLQAAFPDTQLGRYTMFRWSKRTPRLRLNLN